jgi:hypothetical protein
MTAQTFIGTLNVKTCPIVGCGVIYGVEATADQRRFQVGGGWFCTNGHALVYTESDVQRLQKALDDQKRHTEYAENRATSANARATQIERSRRAIKGVLTRTAKRVAAGVCPCCNRSFGNLSRHMAHLHPSYVKEHKEHDVDVR